MRRKKTPAKTPTPTIPVAATSRAIAKARPPKGKAKAPVLKDKSISKTLQGASSQSSSSIPSKSNPPSGTLTKPPPRKALYRMGRGYKLSRTTSHRPVMELEDLEAEIDELLGTQRELVALKQVFDELIAVIMDTFWDREGFTPPLARTTGPELEGLEAASYDSVVTRVFTFKQEFDEFMVNMHAFWTFVGFTPPPSDRTTVLELGECPLVAAMRAVRLKFGELVVGMRAYQRFGSL